MGTPAKKRCPSCGGKDTRHSVRSGILDALMQMFHRRPFRCRNCRRRFYAYEVDPLPSDLEEDDETFNHHF